jgi:hypothetical protein
MRAALDRPRLWRVTAALSAILLLLLALACAQGSLTILAHPPAPAAAAPGWVRWCTAGVARRDRRRMAWCARVQGRVIDTTHGPGPREAHVAVLADFHLVVVRLPEGAPTPGWGAQIVAVGPLFHARDNQREVQAFWWQAT